MMRYLFLFLFLFLTLTACSESSASQGESSPFAIINVTLLDGQGGDPRPNAGVIVRDGLIVRVLESGEDVPPGMTTVNGEGGYLVPGFIDMHAHLLVPRCQPVDPDAPFDRDLSEQMLATLVDFGITTVRSPATPTVEGMALRDDLNSGQVAGPHAYASAELINDPRMSDEDLRQYVQDASTYGPDYIKVYSRLTPHQVGVVITEAHRLDLPVIGHLQKTSWREGAELGIDHLTHAVDWSPQTLRPQYRDAYTRSISENGMFRARLDWLEWLDLEAPEVDDMIEAITSRGISIDPTLVAYDSKFSPPAAGRYRQNPYVDIVPRLHSDWVSCGAGTSDWNPTDFQRWERLFPKLKRFVKLMHERGVPLTTGSDLTNPWVIPGESLHQEFELLVEAGLEPRQVLRMTGANAAISLGRNDIGRIEVGRRADLVLLDANPYADIRNTRRIVWVMQSGKRTSSGPPSR